MHFRCLCHMRHFRSARIGRTRHFRHMRIGRMRDLCDARRRPWKFSRFRITRSRGFGDSRRLIRLTYFVRTRRSWHLAHPWIIWSGCLTNVWRGRARIFSCCAWRMRSLSFACSRTLQWLVRLRVSRAWRSRSRGGCRLLRMILARNASVDRSSRH